MRIAHFVNVTPKQCGLYESTRELCLAECELGHDAKLVDTIGNNHMNSSFRFERGCEIANSAWASGADVFVLHSSVPEMLWNTKPTVMALHGPPEYVLYSELHGHRDGDGGFRTLMMYGGQAWIKKFVTFWDRHVRFWQAVYGEDRVALVPAPVDLCEFTPEGDKFQFEVPGNPNIVYCDTWRPTFGPRKDPVQTIIGVREYWKAHPETRLQIFGIPSDKTRMEDFGGVYDKFILAVKRQGDFFGSIHEMHGDMPAVYRAADVVITTSVEAGRIVRESLACGTPIVAPHGNPFTEYTCDMNYPETIAEALEEALQDKKANAADVRGNSLMRSKQFDSTASAREFVKVLESVV